MDYANHSELKKPFSNHVLLLNSAPDMSGYTPSRGKTLKTCVFGTTCLRQQPSQNKGTVARYVRSAKFCQQMLLERLDHSRVGSWTQRAKPRQYITTEYCLSCLEAYKLYRIKEPRGPIVPCSSKGTYQRPAACANSMLRDTILC